MLSIKKWITGNPEGLKWMKRLGRFEGRKRLTDLFKGIKSVVIFSIILCNDLLVLGQDFEQIGTLHQLQTTYSLTAYVGVKEMESLYNSLGEILATSSQFSAYCNFMDESQSNEKMTFFLKISDPEFSRLETIRRNIVSNLNLIGGIFNKLDIPALTADAKSLAEGITFEATSDSDSSDSDASGNDALSNSNDAGNRKRREVNTPENFDDQKIAFRVIDGSFTAGNYKIGNERDTQLKHERVSYLFEYSKFKDDAERLKKIYEPYKNQGDLSKNVVKDQICNVYLQTAENTVRYGFEILGIFDTAIELLLLDKVLPPAFFNPESYSSLESIWQGYGIDENYLTDIQEKPKFSHLPYILFQHGENWYLRIILPKIKETYKLLSFKQIDPIVFVDNQAYALKVSPLTIHLLAQSKQGAGYLEITQDELDQCIKIKNEYYCESLISFTNINGLKRTSCVASLHERNKKDVMKNCDLTLKPVDFYISKKDPGTYTLFSKSPINIEYRTETSSGNGNGKFAYQQTLFGDGADGSVEVQMQNDSDALITADFRVQHGETSGLGKKPTPGKKKFPEDFWESFSTAFDPKKLKYHLEHPNGFFDPFEPVKESYYDRHLFDELYYLQFLISLCIFKIIATLFAACFHWLDKDGLMAEYFKRWPWCCKKNGDKKHRSFEMRKSKSAEDAENAESCPPFLEENFEEGVHLAGDRDEPPTYCPSARIPC